MTGQKTLRTSFIVTRNYNCIFILRVGRIFRCVLASLQEALSVQEGAKTKHEKKMKKEKVD